MKILLLGASGFVGRNVSNHLTELAIPFQASSRSSGYDLTQPEQARRLFEQVRPELVVNCAAHVGSLNYVTQRAADVMRDNVRMMINMYEAFVAVNPAGIIINPIANCAYPAKAETFVEDHWWDGHLHRSVLSYGATRRLLWSVGESYSMQFGLRTINLLVPNMYGPHDSTDPNKAHALSALISKFVKADKLNQKEVDIWGTGVAIREWLYAPDFARIIGAIVTNPNLVGLAEPLNIGQNFGLSVRELAQIINGYFENRFSIRWDHTMPDGAPKKVMDDTRFRKVFKDFAFTPFEQGVDKTIAYYQSIYPY